jgi:hypothetical protein
VTNIALRIAQAPSSLNLQQLQQASEGQPLEIDWFRHGRGHGPIPASEMPNGKELLRMLTNERVIEKIGDPKIWFDRAVDVCAECYAAGVFCIECNYLLRQVLPSPV